MIKNLCPLTHQQSAHAGALLAALLLCAAFTMEYAMNLPPCTLCWWQRYGLMASVPAGLIAWLKPCTARPMLALVAAGFLASGGIGFFHVGVEQGWWTFDSGCTAGIATNGSLDDLRTAILSAPITRCDEPLAVFFGVSLAAWNALFSGIVGIALMLKALLTCKAS